MENDNNAEQFEKVEIFDSPEALKASMEADSSAPAVEATPDVAPEATPVVEDTPQLEPQPEAQPEAAVTEDVPVEPQPAIEQTPAETTNTADYSDQDIEGAVFQYLSERLGRDINSLDSLSAPQQSALDGRIEAIAKFVEDTGRGPEDWFAYQQLNPSEMDDMTAVRVNMASEYSNLSREELGLLIGSKYKLDPDIYSEEEVKLAQLQLKIDGQKAKGSIGEMRDTYLAPEVQSNERPRIVNDEWVSNMKKEVEAIKGLEFNLGNDKTFTFGLDDKYKSQLVEKNSQLDNYFNSYVRNDGSWDFDRLSSDRAVIDNIDNIVTSAYRQGMSDGQRNIVNKAANVSTDSPQATPQTENPLADQVRNIIRNTTSNKMTFKI